MHERHHGWVCWLVLALLAGCAAPARSPWATDTRLPGTSIAEAQANTKASPTGGARFEADEPAALDKVTQSLTPSNIQRQIKTAVGLGPDEAIARQHYAEGQQLFDEKKYAAAAGKFKSAAGRWPDSMLEEDALYMQAESLFFSDQYYKASDVYTNLLKKYENSRHLDKITARHFAIGKYWEEQARGRSGLMPNVADKTRPWLDQTGNAIAIYNSIRMNDPTGPLADDATMATANAYFLNSRFDDAAYHYDLVRKDYPNSEHQLQAHVLGLQSKMRAYQGPQYDGKMLKQAGDLAENTLTQFSSQLGDEKERIERARLAVIAQQAERDYESGEYYRRLGFNRSARIYYNDIIKEYPNTPVANEAQKRLEEIAHLPDEPPDRFRWLTRWFGESKRTF